MSRSRLPASYLKQPTFVEWLEDRRLLSGGEFDSSFSGDGKVTLSPNLTATDVAVQADGKTVVVGTSVATNGNVSIKLARFMLDGQPDPSFGAAGIVTTSIPGTGQRVEAVAIAPDGKIVITGQARVGSGGLSEPEILVMRYNANGVIDTSFSDDGRVLLDLGDGVSTTEGYDVAVQPDGRIVIVGTTYKIPNYDFLVLRFNVNGSLDTNIPIVSTNPTHIGFSFDGVSTVGFGGEDEARAVKLDSAGNIYVAGIVSDGSTRYGGLMKMSSAGALVSSFNGNGLASFKIPGRSITLIQDLLVQGDKVVIAGHSQDSSGSNDFFIARFNSNGKLDPTFDGNGFTITDLGGNDVVEGLASAPVGDGYFVSGRTTSGMALVKYTANGELDGTFAAGGIDRLGFGGTANLARGPGRRLTLAGGAGFATARVLDTGARVVFAGVLNSTATENSTDTASFIAGRTERLPFSTRIYLNIGGTANSSTLLKARDWTASGIVIPGSVRVIDPRPFVDIPANETFVVIPITAQNDSLAEGLETITFSVAQDPSYEIGSPNEGIVRITDDDGVNSDLPVADDAYVKDGSAAGANFGSAPVLEVKTSGPGFNRLSYLKFNIASFGVIERAKLVLFGRLNDGQNTNVPVQLFPVANTSWNGSTLNFNNRPAPGATPLSLNIVTDTILRPYEFDISSYVKSERALGHTVVSFMLRSSIATNSVVQFNSGNAGGNRPIMSIVTPIGVGIFTASAPPKQVRAGDEVKIAVDWTVPLNGWRKLRSVDLRLLDPQTGSTALLRFNEPTNSFDVIGATGELARDGVALVPGKSSIQAAGPTSPTVTVNYVFRFNERTAMHRYLVAVSAINDGGLHDAFSPIGSILVNSGRSR